MAFFIRFLDEPPHYEKGMAPSARGLLSIGDWSEGFHSSLYLWTKSDYERQWRQAIRELLSGAAKAALITEFLTPDVSSHLVWWPMYRKDETIYIQNHLLFFEDLTKPSSPDSPLSSLRDREITSKDGDLISEWTLPVSELFLFSVSLESGAR